MVDMKIYYYTRASFVKNWCEMMGSANIVRWILPIPFFGRQDHKLTSNEPEDLKAV
jgi:hypothetical protein